MKGGQPVRIVVTGWGLRRWTCSVPAESITHVRSWVYPGLAGTLSARKPLPVGGGASSRRHSPARRLPGGSSTSVSAACSAQIIRWRSARHSCTSWSSRETGWNHPWTRWPWLAEHGSGAVADRGDGWLPSDGEE